MEKQLLARLMAHRLFVERLVASLMETKGFASMRLVSDLSQIEAQVEAMDLPEDVLDALSDELQNIIDAVQAGRGHPPR